VADVTNESDVARIVDETVKRFGSLDVLVNNAGILLNGSIENTSLEQFDAVFNTNVRSVYHLTMLAVPHLIKSKGAIVNLSSVAGTRAVRATRFIFFFFFFLSACRVFFTVSSL
jgi:NAD(P)-dependent dehydrogenase (short-subunit alcohol dehydrogenase family)